jgi:hypothetical protein
MAAAIWHDTNTGAPSKRSLITYDHWPARSSDSISQGLGGVRRAVVSAR